MITRARCGCHLPFCCCWPHCSFWIERSVQLTANGSEAAQTDPEGIMENFDALRTDPAGNPHYRLSAKKLSIIPAASAPNWNRPASSSSTPRPVK